MRKEYLSNVSSVIKALSVIDVPDCVYTRVASRRCDVFFSIRHSLSYHNPSVSIVSSQTTMRIIPLIQSLIAASLCAILSLPNPGNQEKFLIGG